MLHVCTKTRTLSTDTGLPSHRKFKPSKECYLLLFTGCCGKSSPQPEPKLKVGPSTWPLVNENMAVVLYDEVLTCDRGTRSYKPGLFSPGNPSGETLDNFASRVMKQFSEYFKSSKTATLPASIKVRYCLTRDIITRRQKEDIITLWVDKRIMYSTYNVP